MSSNLNYNQFNMINRAGSDDLNFQISILLKSSRDSSANKMEQLQSTCEPAAKNEKASQADETKKPIVDVPKSYKLTSTPEMGR
jgi:hypothetical protein